MFLTWLLLVVMLSVVIALNNQWAGTFFPVLPRAISSIKYVRNTDSKIFEKSEGTPLIKVENDPYLKHSCKSCSFVYDEEKGFKKRFPPG